MIDLRHGDCLELMQDIPIGSIDAIICDLPYGTTACKWDTVIPFEPLWNQYNRIIKDNGAIVLFGSEPFSSHLRMSNIKNYKYDWIWDKTAASNFLLAKKQPLRCTENISVFGSGTILYNPQKVKGSKNHSVGRLDKINYSDLRGAVPYLESDTSGMKYPKNIINIPKYPYQSKLHPTQKPVALLEYLVKTYTNENETVLDNTMGSGSTGIACQNTNRNFIGIELDENYYNIAKKRIEENSNITRLF